MKYRKPAMQNRGFININKPFLEKSYGWFSGNYTIESLNRKSFDLNQMSTKIVTGLSRASDDFLINNKLHISWQIND